MTASQQHLVIIGGGMAGARLAQNITQNIPDLYRVTLISEEAFAGYNRIMLSSLLANEASLTELSMLDRVWFEQHGGCLYENNPAVDVNTSSRSICLKDGVTLYYDKLVFATGSRVQTHAIAGIHASNIMGFRQLQDVARMQSLPVGSHAVVIGGGLLGLEAAVGLVKCGYQVTLVHRAQYIMNRQLDQQAASLLQQRLERMGIVFRLAVSPTAFHLEPTQSQAKSVELSSGECVAGDLFVLATGIVPEISLARKTGVRLDKAIVVDGNMRTSMPHIYAIGECCEFMSQTFGLVAPIWQQIEALIAALSGQSQPFHITPVPTKLKVSGVQLFSVGDISHSEATTSCYWLDSSQGHYRKLYVKDDRLVGAILYGNVADGNWFFQLIQQQTKIHHQLDQLIFGEAFCPEVAA